MTKLLADLSNYKGMQKPTGYFISSNFQHTHSKNREEEKEKYLKKEKKKERKEHRCAQQEQRSTRKERKEAYVLKSDEVPVSFNKMDGFSTVDGFLEITECLADMIKYLANEPSVGLFYIQQHSHSTVPNLVNIKSKVEDKSREMTLHTEDSEDSITTVRSMKECGFPIVNEMIKDIKKSLVIMSTKGPKKGLINNPSSRFQMGRTSSWVSTTSQQDSESTSNYFTTVLKSAKERAGNLKWPQFDSSTYLNPTLPFTVANTSSTMPSMEVEELPLSQTANQLQEDESHIDGSLVNVQLSSLSENFDAFRADQEAKLEEWLKGTSDQNSHIGETNAEGL